MDDPNLQLADLLADLVQDGDEDGARLANLLADAAQDCEDDHELLARQDENDPFTDRSLSEPEVSVQVMTQSVMALTIYFKCVFFFSD
jgi:hypothetical protein